MSYNSCTPTDNYSNCLYNPTGEIVQSYLPMENKGPYVKQCRKIDNPHPFNNLGAFKGSCEGCVCPPPPSKPEPQLPDCYRFKSLENKRAYLADVMRGNRELNLCDPLKEPKCHRIPNNNPQLAYQNNNYKDTCAPIIKYDTFEDKIKPIEHIENNPYTYDNRFVKSEMCYDRTPIGYQSNNHYNLQNDFDHTHNYY